MNSFVIIKISLTNLVFESIISSKEFLLPNEFSEANLNASKRILNWQPFMKKVDDNLCCPPQCGLQNTTIIKMHLKLSLATSQQHQDKQ